MKNKLRYLSTINTSYCVNFIAYSFWIYLFIFIAWSFYIYMAGLSENGNGIIYALSFSFEIIPTIGYAIVLISLLLCMFLKKKEKVNSDFKINLKIIESNLIYQLFLIFSVIMCILVYIAVIWITIMTLKCNVNPNLNITYYIVSASLFCIAILKLIKE